MLKPIGRTAGRIALGVAAGAAGTAAMTLAQKIEMKATGREPSTMPADTVDEIADLAPEDEDKRQRFSNLVHWGYGTGWGALRGLLGSTPLGATAADAFFFGVVWGAPKLYMPALELTKPVTQWGAKQLALDFGHHLVYATAVALTWRALISESGLD